MTRRTIVRRVGLCLVASSMLSGGTTRKPCGSHTTPTLRIAVANPTDGPGNRMLASVMFNATTLIRTDQRGRPTRGLAHAWHTTDRRTWTFTFDERLRTHGGQPLSAAVIKEAVLQRVASPDSSFPLWQDLDGIDTPAPTTIVFRFRRPTSLFAEALASFGVWMGLPKAPLEDGPYRLIRDTHREMEFEAFPGFWGGVPVPPKLHFQFYSSPRAAWTAFLRREVDFLYAVPPAAATLLARHPDVRLYASSNRYVYTLAFQQRHPVLRDVRVRRALNLAIDRDAIGRRLFGPYWQVASSPFSPAYWAMDGLDAPWPYDPAEARRLLQTALGSRREPLELTCLTSSEFPLVADVAADLEAQLQRVNVKLRLEALPMAQVFARLGRGEFEVFLLNEVTGIGSLWPSMIWHSRAPQNEANTGYTGADAELEMLWRAGTDDEERAALRAVLEAMRRDPPAAFLVSTPTIRAVHRAWHVPEDTPDIRQSIPRWTFEDTSCGGS